MDPVLRPQDELGQEVDVRGLELGGHVELPQDGADDDLLLHLGELLADAVARAGGEGHVGVGVPLLAVLVLVDVVGVGAGEALGDEGVGVGELLGVAVEDVGGQDDVRVLGDVVALQK